jgi:16S rRNA pseudouridine516 synthase
MDRLDKILSNLGHCSRRQSQEYIRSHDIRLEGKRVLDGAMKVDIHNLQIDGQKPDHPDGIFIMMNKPSGYVCSHEISEGSRIYDLLPPQWMKRDPVPSTIGRLDKDTTGLILITDITKLNHSLSAPSKRIDKKYIASVDKPLTPGLIEVFSSGKLLLHNEPKPCLPAKLEIIDDLNAAVTICEGRYHQVKRMFAACGYNVEKLHREQFGKYVLGDLEEGKYVDLAVPQI